MNKLSAQFAAAVAATLLLVPAAYAQQTQRPGPGGTAVPMQGGQGMPMQGGQGMPMQGGQGMPMQGGQGMPMRGGQGMSQSQKDMMQSMAGATTPAGSEAEKSMMAAMEKMSQTMRAVPMTGNADRDFVTMMIPHHAGAIDMARFELANGKDPAMRKLAEAIVSAQESEISEMQAWQKANPGTQ
jgi:uncharacterized protein (DUF305 family)